MSVALIPTPEDLTTKTLASGKWSVDCIVVRPAFSNMADLIREKAIRYDGQNKFVLSDDILFTKENKQIVTRGARGTGLLAAKNRKYTGDIKDIKNVYFVRDTSFDRAYFRRLYPEINIRRNIESAEVIIYDEQAIFSNDITPPVYKLVTIEGQNYCWSLDNSIPNFYYGIKSTIHRSTFPRWDDQNSKIIDYITNSRNFNSSVPIRTIREDTGNEYFEKLIAANKPFIHVQDFFSSRHSSSRSNNFQYSDLVSLAHQLMSEDANVSLAACETLLQYNSQLYLPIQSFLFYMTSKDQHYSNFLESKKFQIFKKTYLEKIAGSLFSHQASPRQEVMGAQNRFLSYGRLVEWIARWAQNDYSAYDLSYLKKFLYSADLFDIMRPQEKSMTIQINNLNGGQGSTPVTISTAKAEINTGSIVWTLTNKNLANPDYYVGEPTIAAEAQGVSIDEVDAEAEFGV